jgi:hypothetical protein
MNPRAVGDFLKSKFGLFVVFVIVLMSGLAIYGRREAKEREVARHSPPAAKKVELGQVKVPLNQGLESGVPQQARVVAAAPSEKEVTSGEIVPFRPVPAVTPPPPKPPTKARPSVKSAPVTKAPPKKKQYPSLLATYEVPVASTGASTPPTPDRFLPFGTLLKCKLVNTVDSANLETPVIALLLEDVWQNGKLVLPANTLVHGTARSGRLRDRVTANGAWRLVWQDGRELVFNGVALDREYEHEIDGYGITDGSAGIRGRVLATDDLQELKLLASAALSGFARGTQDRTQNAMGTTITGSVSNGVREGIGEVFELHAKRTLKDVEENGYFVRVAAGKEFYVYVTEAVDPRKATVAGAKPLKPEASTSPGNEQLAPTSVPKG